MDSSLSGNVLSEALKQTITQNVRSALGEDVGDSDLTAELIPAHQIAEASIISREPAIICGMPWVIECFRQLNPEVTIQWEIIEGTPVSAGQTLCKIKGNARAMLTAERCSLNFLQTLSATATVTRRYVDEVAGTQANIFDTRKTIPGMRLAQKYAVTVGGGNNQRMGLYDGILIKENHIMAAGGIKQALLNANRIAKARRGNVSIQIEVENLAQLEIAIAAGAELILLDNFGLQELQDAVKLTRKRAVLEASGGINLSNVKDIALTGVDRISVGELTKNLKAVDLSMRFIHQD
jgi:nicotinate-nucleotide pyrophosphorylase (carboxylating)